MKGMQRRAPVVFSGKLLYCPLIDGRTWVLAYARKQRRKNAVVFATEVVDSLLWVECHSGTVTGLPPKERLQKHIHWSLQLLFCFPAGTVNFLLLRHENMDRLPSFAVDLDEDPTDIFGAVCALLVFSALLKNWTFLWPCLQWKEYCDFWVNSSANSTKINQCLRTGTGWDMVLKSLLPTFTSVFCMVYTGQGLCPVIFHCHPRVVRVLRRSWRITPQSNSPMPVLPTMQSDDIRQENMATVLNIPLKCFKRKRFIHSTIAELQVPMAVYFLYRNSANDDLW